MIGLMIGAPDVFPSPNSVIRRTSEPPDAVEASDAGRGPDICCPQSWVRGSLLLTSVCFASSSFCSKHPLLLHHLPGPQVLSTVLWLPRGRRQLWDRKRSVCEAPGHLGPPQELCRSLGNFCWNPSSCSTTPGREQ